MTPLEYRILCQYKVHWGPFELSGDCFKPEDTGNTAKVALKSLLRALEMDPSEIDSIMNNLKRIREE